MSENQTQQTQVAVALPASSLPDVTAGLLAGRQLAPPARPGLLARLEHHEILRLLGAGGMGVVFQARDTRTGGEIAVKLLKPEFAQEPRIVHRFLTEARHLQKLNHPNLVPVLEVCERPEGSYFVMPYFASGSLAKALQPGVPLPQERALEIALRIAAALQFIHSRGLIHRDVKPGNILLAANSRAVLADFGLARTVFNDSVLDLEQGLCVGTAPYMSPAVAAGEAEDTRCDIYAFGAVLYEMLTGQPPYEGTTAREIRGKILQGPPRPISKLAPKADPKLVAVANAAMARAQRDRYASMADVVSDLRRVQEGKRPLGPHWAFAWPWLVRRRAPKWVWIPAAIAASVALAAWFFWPRLELVVVRQIASPQVSSWLGAFTAQLDFSPEAELLVTDDKTLYRFAADGSPFGKWTCQEPADSGITVRMAADVDVPGDGVAEAFASWTHGKELSLAVVNQHARIIRRFAATGREPHPKNRESTSTLVPLRLVGPEGVRGGHRHLLAVLWTGFGDGDSPRGLCCFDYETQQLLWTYRVGPALETLELLDLDGDGLLDFLVGSCAPNNGNRAEDGTDDSHSYLFAISSEGKRLWSRELGGQYDRTYPIVKDLNRDGRQEILAWTANTSTQAHTHSVSPGGGLVLLDHGGNEVAAYRPNVCLMACAPVEFDGATTVKIACADCNGYVHLLNPDLTLLCEAQVARRPEDTNALFRLVYPVCLQPAKMLPGHGQQLVLARAKQSNYSFENPGDTSKAADRVEYEDACIQILGPNLGVLASVKVAEKYHQGLPWSVKTADMDGDGLDEILSLSDRVTIFKLRRR